uniref:Dynein heavy chain tail domain-containing protein n=1 Tax=Biomphalaria glabrata TaxID=6526 RepID=A0A2C9LBI1_BIOGL
MTLSYYRFDSLNLDFLDIEKGYMDILTLYNYELDNLQHIYERDKEEPPIQWNLPPISGRIYWLRLMFHNIGQPIFTLQNYRPSVMKTLEGKRAIYRYNKFAFVLAKCEVLFHIAWFRSVDAAYNCLQVPILARDPKTRDLIINFDPYVYEVIKEAHYMVKLGLQVPREMIQLIHSCHNITSTYRKVQMMLTQYASLKSTIPDMFMTLMQPSLFKEPEQPHKWTQFGSTFHFFSELCGQLGGQSLQEGHTLTTWLVNLATTLEACCPVLNHVIAAVLITSSSDEVSSAALEVVKRIAIVDPKQAVIIATNGLIPQGK